MQQISLIGINHKTAPIDVRERFFLTPIQQDLLLSEFKSNPNIIEGFVISTCNRTEVYVRTLEGFDPFPYIYNLICSIKQIVNPDAYQTNFYVYSGEKAVSHLLHVACSLDSLILGEKQILGQLKNAFEKAQQRGMFGKVFNVLMNLTLRTGKKSFQETSIGIGGTSVSWAAIAMAGKVLGELQEKEVLVIGAGEMSKLAVGQIQNKNFKKVFLMNRTEQSAKELADRCGGVCAGFGDIKEILTRVDLCICSIGAPHYIVERSMIEKIMAQRQNQPLVLIDISMPRNIDPEAASVSNVRLFAIDDLNEVVDSNMKIRHQSLAEVEAIITEKIAEFKERILSPSEALQEPSIETI